MWVAVLGRLIQLHLRTPNAGSFVMIMLPFGMIVLSRFLFETLFEIVQWALSSFSRLVAWTVIQQNAFGTSGAYYRFSRVKVSEYPTELHSSKYSYMCLPSDVETEAISERAAYIANHSSDLQTLINDQINLESVFASVNAGCKIPLIHSCYFTSKKICSVVALWLSARPRSNIDGRGEVGSGSTPGILAAGVLMGKR